MRAPLLDLIVPRTSLDGRTIDLRPLFALRVGLAVPGGCAELCDNPSVFFPSVGFFGRVSAGLGAFLGPAKTIGIGFEAGIPFGHMGDVDADVAPTNVQFDAPAWEAALTIQVRNSAVRGW